MQDLRQASELESAERQVLWGVPKAMKYLSSTPFSFGGPSKVFPGTCEACLYGRGEHIPECPHRTYTKTDYYFPMTDGSVTRVSYIGTVMVDVEENCGAVVMPIENSSGEADSSPTSP